MPVLAPANVAEYLEFGLYGWALSRFSGNWVGFTALSEVVESGSTVDLDETNARVAAWKAGAEVEAATGFVRPADGLHYRWPDLPSLKIEAAPARQARRGARLREGECDRPPDRRVARTPRSASSPAARRTSTCSRCFRRLDISLDALAAAGVRIYKVGLSYPLEPTRLDAFAEGLDEILVVEEKGGVVETQLRDLFYNRAVRPAHRRQARRARPAAGLASSASCGPSRLIEIVAALAGAALPAARPAPPGARLHRARSCSRTPAMRSSACRTSAPAARTTPRTKVPEGSRAQAGIGCHFMASWMDRDTEGLIQMGGEGVDWVSHSMFTKVPHVFQNLGDGTYYHSGYLAIRQAIAAKTNITYKILFNDAVAMTGGQPVDGIISVDAHRAPGRGRGRDARWSCSRDDIAKYDAIHGRFPGRHRVPRPRASSTRCSAACARCRA